VKHAGLVNRLIHKPFFADCKVDRHEPREKFSTSKLLAMYLRTRFCSWLSCGGIGD